MLGALVLALAAQAPVQGRVACARAECSGPLQGFALTWPDGSGVRATLELAAGESRALDLWLPLPAAGAAGEPELEVEGAGSVRLAPWPDARGEAFAAAWGRVAPGLRARPVPPAPEGGAGPGRLPARALLLAGACLALVFGLRRRPVVALGGGALGAGLVLVAAQPFARAAHAVEVLEGDGSAWLLVRSARSVLVPEAETPARVDTSPAEVGLVASLSEGAWELSAAGAAIVTRRPLAGLAADVLEPARNALEDLPLCWVRGTDGLWSHRGAWPRGAALPGPVDGPAPPAGWIAGLPQGRVVLLAERARSERGDGARAWVRVVGFPDPAGDRH